MRLHQVPRESGISAGLDCGAVLDINNPSFPLPVNPIDAVHRLAPEYTSTGDTLSLACEIDYGNGVVKFRFVGTCEHIPIRLQRHIPSESAEIHKSESVFQWPDDLSYVLFEMLLWQGMRFAYGITAAETQLRCSRDAGRAECAASEDREDNIRRLLPLGR